MSQLLTFVRMASAALLLTASAACSQSVTRPTQDRYTLQINDNIAERRFDMVLKSNDTKPLCLSIEAWPSSTGKFPTENAAVTLKTTQGILPVRSELQSAYCPGGCGEHRIEPKGELRGFIAYEAFDDPTKLATDQIKQLQFSVMPSYCRRQ